MQAYDADAKLSGFSYDIDGSTTGSNGLLRILALPIPSKFPFPNGDFPFLIAIL